MFPPHSWRILPSLFFRVRHLSFNAFRCNDVYGPMYIRYARLVHIPDLFQDFFVERIESLWSVKSDSARQVRCLWTPD